MKFAPIFLNRPLIYQNSLYLKSRSKFSTFIRNKNEESPKSIDGIIDLLKTLAIFLTGSLGGVLASNGLKDKQHKSEYEKALEKRFASSDTPQSRRDS